jgi:hypothetical protein
MLCTQGQLNRRIRALQPELRELQRDFAEELAEPSAVYRVIDTTLVPEMVRACRKGPFAGQASFGRSASKTEWIYGYEAALMVDPNGVVTAFGLAPAASDERPIDRAKTLGSLLTRLAAKIAAYTCAQRMNDFLGRPLRHLADLLV